MLSETRARRCRESARQNLAGNPELSLQNSQRLLDAGLRDPDVLALASNAMVRSMVSGSIFGPSERASGFDAATAPGAAAR